LLVWAGGACWRIVLLVFLEELVGVWWTVTGEHLLLGVLGSGARNPYGILELGSRRGSVPSWLGGKDSVLGRAWAEFQLQLGQTELGKQHHLRGIYVHYYGMFIIVMMVHYFTMLCMLFNMLFISCCSF
jgi:hypothetical protein